MDENGTKAEHALWPQALTFAIFGLVYGGAVALIAVGLSGAGHGWNSASIAVVSVFVVPLLGVAYAYRCQVSGRIIAFVVLALAIILNVVLVTSTISEGTYYFLKIWNMSPTSLVLLGAMWFGWQLLAAIIAFPRSP